MTGPFATGPVREDARAARGKWLEAIFAEGGEVDREVDGAEESLAHACDAERSGAEARRR